MLSRLLETLFSLDRVRITSGTRFSFVWQHPALIVLGCLGLAVLGYLSYRTQSATRGQRRAMGIVRALLLVVVFVLVWRPQLVLEREERTRSVVAVWVDSSASMTLEDPYSAGVAGTQPATGYSDGAMREFMQKVMAAPAATGPALPTGAGRPNRYQLATAALSDTGWLKQLTETQDVAFFTGGGHAQIVGTARSPEQVLPLVAQLRAQTPAADSTDLPAVTREILEKVQGQRVSALVLVTDGQTTEKGSRLDTAATLAGQGDTKVFPMPVGQASEPFDLKLTSLRLPPSTFSKDPVSARVHVSAAGVNGATTARLAIYRKPAPAQPLALPIATKEVALDPAKKEIDAEVSLKLDKKERGKGERFDLIARIEPQAGSAMGEELTLANNDAAGTVTVLEAQINVLYVEGYPRWEYRYLKNELIREPTVNVSTLLTSADPDFTQDADPPVRDKQTGEEKFIGPLSHFPETPEDLAKFDVILLGDVEPTYFSPTQQRLIVDFVKTRGGGLAWIAGGAWNPEHYRDTALEVLLPVTPDEIDPRARVVTASDNAGYNLVITAAGRETNLFRFFPDSELSWKQVSDLPPMYWFKPVQGLKPGAIVLAVHPSRSQGGNPAPLLVSRQYGSGAVLFSAYADTWRWRRYNGEPLFQSYWLQLCRLLYANKALGQSRRLELITEAPRVEVGGAIKVSLNVKDPTLGGQVPAELPVVLMDANGQSVETITLMRAPGTGSGAGVEKLEGMATATRVGGYTLVVRPGLLPVEMPPVELVVEPPQREFEVVTSDLASLGTLASKTGGAIVPPYRTADLPRQIPDRSLPVVVSEAEELWNKPFALILVVLIATTEWLIRKRAGLI